VTAALGLPPDPGPVAAPASRAVRSWAPRRLEGPEALPAPGQGATGEAEATGRASDRDFGDLVVDAVRSVDAQAKDAGRRAQDLAAGRSYDVHGTMIALEESGIATRLLANVRNRAIEAYREIMRMGA